MTKTEKLVQEHEEFKAKVVRILGGIRYYLEQNTSLQKDLDYLELTFKPLEDEFESLRKKDIEAF